MAVTEKKSRKVNTVGRKISKSGKQKYFSGIGRRKASIARVRIFTVGKVGPTEIEVNSRSYSDFFMVPELRDVVRSPLEALSLKEGLRVSAKIRGGGIRGQAEALRLGISRALVEYDSNLKKSLRDLGFLTRDARIVERKKAGLKKARRAPQWKKR